jgi:plasmid stabilization system protein ParE
VRILWTEPAARTYRTLPKSVKLAILERLDVILDFPEMYPLRERQPYSGFRYFFTSGWCVSYTTGEDAIILLAVFAARSGG